VRLRDAIAGTSLAAIAEFKRRSPSAGDIRAGADPAAFARRYEQGGAAAMSVLVDERFAGSWDDLRAARAACTLPLLAKGFFATEDDLLTAREAGADAVLLLLRDLDDDQARLLMRIAADLGLDALVEAHDPHELQRAVQLGADPIGVNARDLATFEIDLTMQLELLAAAPEDRRVIAESGIHTRAQATRAELAGAGAILVGTSLMQAADPEAKLRDLVGRPLVKVCGLTRQEDVDAAADAGADMAGFILAAESPRRAPRVLETPEDVLSVAVVVGTATAEESDLVQYYDREGDHRSRDAVLMNDRGAVAQVLDLPWQQEDPDHFERARTTEGRVMLAGGLSAENVRAAIETVQPWAVDASSRLEVEPGIKDHARVRAYVEAARWS
jgi:indole-3-glycerol phosphate synthase